MKYLSFLTILIPMLLSCSSSKKNFEGVITYTISVTSNRPTPYLDSMKADLGDTMKIYFKGDKYRLVYLGPELELVTIYKNATGKQYAFGNKNDTLYIDDATAAYPGLESYRYLDDTLIITGKKCKSFEIVLSDGHTLIRYYSPELYIDPRMYNNHNFMYTNLLYSKCKSPYLKSISIGKVFNIVYEAVRIEEKSLPDSLFEYPEGRPESSFL